VKEDAWCYEHVRRNGTNDGEYIREVPAVLIPRLIWPDKPLVSHGRDIAVMLGQAKTWESATTATGLSMAGAMYLAWGYPCVVIGMFLNGLTFAVLWRLFGVSFTLRPFAALASMVLMLEAVRWQEAAFDGNAVKFILLVVFLLPLDRLYARMSPLGGWRAGQQPAFVRGTKCQI